METPLKGSDKAGADCLGEMDVHVPQRADPYPRARRGSLNPLSSGA
ncbi:hypothetical protein ACF1GT_04880 [Streptomyces sp. NPDC014636]